MEPGAPVPSPALPLTRRATRGQVTHTLFCASILAPGKHRWTQHLLDRGAGREASGFIPAKHSAEPAPWRSRALASVVTVRAVTSLKE